MFSLIVFSASRPFTGDWSRPQPSIRANKGANVRQKASEQSTANGRSWRVE
jgi:hypothetical protein